MSWLADASANKIVKSYIKDFVDISGNFKVRNTVSGTSIDTMDVSGGIVSFFQAETDSTVDTGPVAWSQLGADIDGEAAGDRSGYSVSISSDGTTVAIGAYDND